MNYAGRIGKVIKHEIKKAVEIVTETRKGYNQKGVLFNSSGEDSPPIESDRIVLLKIDGTGKCAIVGVFNESQGAKPGEKIFFARDRRGKIKSQFSMLGNGEINFIADSDFSQTIKGKYFMGNENSNMQELLLCLVDEIKNIITFGHPTQHAIHPETILSLDLYKNKIKSLFKDGA